MRNKAHRRTLAQSKGALEEKRCVGILEWMRALRAYVQESGEAEPPMLRVADIGGAMHGDKVRIVGVRVRRREGYRRHWRIIEVLKRARTQWVGRLARDPKGHYVIPDHKYVYRRLSVPATALGGAAVGDKVLVKAVDWARTGRAALNTQVLLRLGQSGEHQAEMHSLLLAFDIPLRFPKDVQEAADALRDDTQQPSAHKGREDIRHLPTCTIDPVDAKDFDDALSVRACPNDQVEVGIHIADVSHYVRAGSLLDQEAAERSTSVYLVDRTVPMLPERLSNGLCSLQPHCDRLCFSVFFVLTKKGVIQSHRFAKTLIRSKHRFTYEDAQHVLDTAKGPYARELKVLHAIAVHLRARRFAQGALHLHAPEFEFQLNEQGTPIDLRVKPEMDTHFLIEEFMLLANRQVAEYVAERSQQKKMEAPFIYRVHDNPDQDKLATLRRYALKFGHELAFKPSVAGGINQLLRAAQHQTEAVILNTLAIRSMAAAEYSCQKLHHFGLGFTHYTHFTSPIRRYPDVLVHRLLAQYLHTTPNGQPTNDIDYASYCVHASAQEKRANEVERASVKYKQVEYMQKHIGDTFDGMVSGLTEWGIYVTLQPHQCEGMVRLSSLRGERYHLDPKALCLRGARSGRRIEFGDKVEVRLLRADLDKRSLSLELTHPPKTPVHRPKRRKRKRR